MYCKNLLKWTKIYKYYSNRLYLKMLYSQRIFHLGPGLLAYPVMTIFGQFFETRSWLFCIRIRHDWVNNFLTGIVIESYKFVFRWRLGRHQSLQLDCIIYWATTLKCPLFLYLGCLKCALFTTKIDTKINSNDILPILFQLLHFKWKRFEEFERIKMSVAFFMHVIVKHFNVFNPKNGKNGQFFKIDLRHLD